MASLVESVLQQTREREREQRLEAAAEYQAILSREAASQDGDAERLVAAMSILGRTMADLQADRDAVARIVLLDQLAAEHDTRNQAAADANCANNAAVEWATQARAELERQIAAKLSRYGTALRTALDAVQVSRQAKRDLPEARLWLESLVEGVPESELRGQRIAAERERCAAGAGQARRDRALRDLQRDHIAGVLHKRDGSYRAAVDTTLRSSGLAPITAAEWAECFPGLPCDAAPEPVLFPGEKSA